MTAREIVIELIGVLGFIANVWANIWIARKLESGWIVRLAANALWLAYGLIIISVANILSSAVFTVINIYALRRWRRERHEAVIVTEFVEARRALVVQVNGSPRHRGISLEENAQLTALYHRWERALEAFDKQSTNRPT